jgi:hypothetical protein
MFLFVCFLLLMGVNHFYILLKDMFRQKCFTNLVTQFDDILLYFIIYQFDLIRYNHILPVIYCIM